MNKINYKTGILSLLLFFVAWGCKDDDDELRIPHLEVGERALSFNESEVQTLAIEANGHWRVRAVIRDTNEFLISPREGFGNGEVTITLNRTKPEAINGYLKVTYLDGTDEGLEVAKGVRLTADKLDMNVYPRSVTFNSAAGYTQQKLRVYSSGQWTARLSDTTWCKLANGKGEDEGYVTLLFKEGAEATEEGTELIIAPDDKPLVRYVVKVSDAQGHKYGRSVTLHKATKGAGINIVMVGTFFLKNDLKKGGRFDQACESFMKYAFVLEPFSSYVDYFNVYAVPYPNDYDEDLFGNREKTYDTPIGTYNVNESMAIGMTSVHLDNLYKYAFQNTPVSSEKETLQDLFVVSAVCSDDWAYMRNYTNNYPGSTQGRGVTFAPIFAGDLTTLFGRELQGHNFGNFFENTLGGDKVFPEEQKSGRRDLQKNNQLWLDVEFINDTEQFMNQAWVELYKMNYRNVSIVEGAQDYASGIWRAASQGIMGNGDNKGNVDGKMFYYNPVQRELILRKIYQLSGLEEEYSLQTFLDYDKNNVTNIRTDEEMMKN